MNNVSVIFSDDARKKLEEGINLVANAVATTLGPRGRNSVIYSEYGSIITKDGVSVAKAITSVEDPQINIGVQLCKQVSMKTNDVAGDGPQPLYSSVLTPTGFTEMGKLSVGDEICGTNGTTQRVTGVFPKGNKEIFKIKLFDGREVECCEDHLWSVVTDRGTKKTITVKQMFKNYTSVKSGRVRRKYYVPLSKAEFSESQLPLDPYLVGALLGDGSLSGTGSVELSLGPNDSHIIDKIKLPEGIYLKSRFIESKNYYRVKIQGKTVDGKSIKNILNDIGLLGVKSESKFIPKLYLFSSMGSRNKLLQGLLDTDGHINKRGRFEYGTVSLNLANDFMQLIRGLGKTARLYKYDRKKNKSYSMRSIYRITEIKGRKHGNSIVGITPTGNFTKMQCISVSNSDNLYFTDGYTLTHNTTTATVLAQAIVKEGLKYIASGANPLSLKRGIDKAMESALILIDANSKSIEEREEIEFVATISGNDAEVGRIVAEAIVAVGSDGIITLEESRGNETHFQMVDGFTYNQGYVSPYLINDGSKNVADYKDVTILMFDCRIDAFEKIYKVLEELNRHKKPVLIIAEGFSDSAMQGIIVNKSRGALPWVATKTPGFGEQKKELIQDICALVGGTVFNESLGHKWEEIDSKFFGFAKRVIVSKDSTTVIEGTVNENMVNDRLELLKTLLESEESDYAKEKLNERIGKLSGGVAMIKISAATELELKEKKYRYEDALSATRAAITGGIVPGGGTCLLRISEVLLETTKYDEKDTDEMLGVKILKKAIRSPFNLICENGGFSSDVYSEKVLMSDFPIGFDAKYCEMVNMIEVGIVDPAKVTKSALINAVSIAGLVLTTETLISPVYDKSEKFIMADPMY